LLCFIDIIVTYFYMKLKAPYHCVHATNYKSIFFLNSGLKTAVGNLLYYYPAGTRC